MRTIPSNPPPTIEDSLARVVDLLTALVDRLPPIDGGDEKTGNTTTNTCETTGDERARKFKDVPLKTDRALKSELGNWKDKYYVLARHHNQHCTCNDIY